MGTAPATHSSFHASPVTVNVGVGATLNTDFMLIRNNQVAFNALYNALPDPGRLAQVLVPYLWLITGGQLDKGLLSSLLIEAIYEHIRVKQFSTERPSRLYCAFACVDLAGARRFAQSYRPNLPHVYYEIAPPAPWFADMGVLNKGFDLPGNFPSALSRHFQLASRYWTGMTSDAAAIPGFEVPEVLISEPCPILSVAGPG